ncbi:hypothetical protein EUX98_g4128 [Antrodiella citrinella]|uniref:Uncharacterized protein n=1 Tax=Antrodiella citrinella TaxID=2447956 RepID=A0A4S4MWW2_9APHY|nr:hypothetical protein EUX98_g4128 [Antrodiella citrinella]
MSDSHDDLFNYSSGRWLVNNDLRLAERRREFDVDELCRLAAQSVGRSPQDIDTFVKLAEGGFNRTFLITMHGGFEMVARIPYPVTVPKFYAIASEVATMRFLRSSGLPVPEVYDYSSSSDNAAKTEYIFMEFMRRTKLSDVWLELEEPDIVSVLRQTAQLESRMMSIPFPAGGSLPSRRIVARPQEPSPPSFPLQPTGNRGPARLATCLDSTPPFLLAGIPDRLQNYDDPVSQALIPPSLPANVDRLDQSEQSDAMGLYHRRLVHFHYVKNTQEYNKFHHDALSDPVSMFVRRLFDQAGAPWEGETHALKASLIEATEIWGRLTGEGVPCPVVFEPEDLHKTKELSARLQIADEIFEGCRGIVGFETETWVSNEHYEMAMALAELLKLRVLTHIPEEEVRAKTEANWFLNDMDEKDYM